MLAILAVAALSVATPEPTVASVNAVLRNAYPALNWAKPYRSGDGCVTAIGPEVSVRICQDDHGGLASLNISSRHGADAGSVGRAVRAMSTALNPGVSPAQAANAADLASRSLARGKGVRLCPGLHCARLVPYGPISWSLSAAM